MGSEVGGGFSMGNTCTPVADSCQCMAKPIQYCKVISLQKKKIHGFIYTTRVHITTALWDRNFWAGMVISGLFLEAMIP